MGIRRALPSPSNRRRSEPHPLVSWHEDFVRVSGEIVGARVETSERADKVDHVWIDVLAGEYGPLQLSLSTYSRQSHAAGFDPRVWVGMVQSRWSALPEAGIFRAPPFNYATLALEQPIDFVPYERRPLEKLLVEKTERALWAEAWGDLHVRGHAGVHQIHSRRPSFAVPVHHVGRDGALRLYYKENATSEMLLFKFAGQP